MGDEERGRGRGRKRVGESGIEREGGEGGGREGSGEGGGNESTTNDLYMIVYVHVNRSVHMGTFSPSKIQGSFSKWRSLSTRSG